MKENTKTIIIIGIFLIIPIILTIVAGNYRYNKCVRINKEELKKCEKGEFGNYDCSVFENAEEICTYYIDYVYDN